MRDDIAPVLLHIFYGVVAYVASHIVHRVYQAYRVPRDSLRWLVEIEEDLVGLIRAHLTVAMYRHGIALKMDKVPKDFEDPLMVASELGFVAERMFQAEAEALGLVKPRTWRVEPFTEGSASCLDVPAVVRPSPQSDRPQIIEMPAVPQLPAWDQPTIPPPPRVPQRTPPPRVTQRTPSPRSAPEPPLLILGPNGDWVPRSTR